MQLFELYFPLEKVKFNKNVHKVEKWMTQGLLLSRLTKLRLAKACFECPSPTAEAKFKSFRNVYNKTVRASKKLFFETELQAHHSNLKKTWEILNSAIKKCKKANVISSLRIDNVESNDPFVIASKFNEFFTTIAEEIA